jgi:hypothetical protein
MDSPLASYPLSPSFSVVSSLIFLLYVDDDGGDDDDDDDGDFMSFLYSFVCSESDYSFKVFK